MTIRIVDIVPAHFLWVVALPQAGSLTWSILGPGGYPGQCRGLSQKSWYQPFEGGLGLYKANAAHGPFVHVDVRGYPARWGP